MQQTKLKTKKGQNSFYSNDTLIKLILKKIHFKFYLLTETFCVQESSSIEVGNTRMIIILICNLYFMDIMLNPLSLMFRDSRPSCLVFAVSGNMQVI